MRHSLWYYKLCLFYTYIDFFFNYPCLQTSKITSVHLFFRSHEHLVLYFSSSFSFLFCVCAIAFWTQIVCIVFTATRDLIEVYEWIDDFFLFSVWLFSDNCRFSSLPPPQKLFDKIISVFITTTLLPQNINHIEKNELKTQNKNYTRKIMPFSIREEKKYSI